MIIVLRKNFTNILNTNGVAGFIRGRKYDMDMDRLGRGEYKRQLGSASLELSREMRNLNKELNNGLMGKWQDTD